MDAISTVLPVGLALSATKGLITGKPSFVGDAQAEAKITDGATGELLAAAIDRRVGSKNLAESLNSMNDVQGSNTARSSYDTGSARHAMAIVVSNRAEPSQICRCPAGRDTRGPEEELLLVPRYVGYIGFVRCRVPHDRT